MTEQGNKWKAIAIVLFLLVVETSAVTILKSQSQGAVNPWMFASGILLYGLVGAIFWWALTTYSNMALVNGIWQVGDIVLVTLVAVIFFQERLRPIHWVGVFLGALAAGCMLAPTS